MTKGCKHDSFYLQALFTQNYGFNHSGLAAMARVIGDGLSRRRADRKKAPSLDGA